MELESTDTTCEDEHIYLGRILKSKSRLLIKNILMKQLGIYKPTSVHQIITVHF